MNPLKLLRWFNIHRHDNYPPDACEFVVEPLETRRLLTGTVAVSFSNSGVLTLRGDNASNRVEVYTIGADTYVSGVATYLRYDGMISSAINLGTSPIVDVRINMRGGDDWVSLTNVAIADDLRVTMGAGTDNLDILDTHVQDDTRIAMGAGEDFVHTLISSFGDRYVEVLGNSPDHSRHGNSVFGGQSSWNAGSGDDMVYLVSTQHAAPVTFNMGSGNDLAHFSQADIQGRFRLVQGSGDDLTQFDKQIIVEPFEINGGGGYDRFVYNLFDPGFTLIEFTSVEEVGPGAVT
ncbi:MAG: hypothetical protein KDA60_01935 [Planctomycetales bacterium]|nr:hypothetical protein [Planctomycetales bacterium]